MNMGIIIKKSDFTKIIILKKLGDLRSEWKTLVQRLEQQILQGSTIFVNQKKLYLYSGKLYFKYKRY